MGIYLLSGPIACGKGAASEKIEEDKGKDNVSVFTLSDILREEVNQRGLPETRDTLATVGEELRDELGEGALAEKIKPHIEENINKGINTVVDSIRKNEEVEVIKNYFSDSCLMYIQTSMETRLDRLKSRARRDDMAMEDIQEVLQRELEVYDFQEIEERADVRVNGELAKEQMKEMIGEKLQEFQEGNQELKSFMAPKIK